MSKKTSSIKRAFDLYSNKNATEIAIIQAAYQNKDYVTLRQMFNSNASNSTLLAYGRLGSQYIKEISQPNLKTQQYVKREYNEILSDSNNLVNNAQNNIAILQSKEKIKKGSLYPNFSKNKVYDSKFKKDKVSNQNEINFDTANISKLEQFNAQFGKNIAFYNRNHKKKVKNVRVIIKYKLSDGSEQYYSTKKVKPSKINDEISQAMLDLTYSDSKHWKSISPTNKDIITELYNGSMSIDSIVDYEIDYYY